MMHDADPGVAEAAEQIVTAEMDRHLSRLSESLLRMPELMHGVAEQMSALMESLEPFRQTCKEIHDYEAEVVAFMDEQMDF